VDDRARGLERAATGGDVDAAARVLWERVRRGELDLDRVRLAAFLADPVSRLALGAQAPELPPTLGTCVRQLEAWGPQATFRAAITAVTRVLYLITDPERRSWSRTAMEAVALRLRGLPDDERWVRAASSLRSDPAAQAVLQVAQLGRPGVYYAEPVSAVMTALFALSQGGRADGEEDVGSAVRAALTAWVLGGVDVLTRLDPPADPTLWDAPANLDSLPRPPRSFLPGRSEVGGRGG
jgi:hypothetical protein